MSKSFNENNTLSFSKDKDRNGKINENIICIQHTHYEGKYSVENKHLVICEKFSYVKNDRTNSNIVSEIENIFSQKIETMRIFFCNNTDLILNLVDHEESNIFIHNSLMSFIFFSGGGNCNSLHYNNCTIDSFENLKNISFKCLEFNYCTISEEFLFFLQNFSNVSFKNCKIRYNYNFKNNFGELLSVLQQNNNLVYNCLDEPDEYEFKNDLEFSLI